MIALQIVLPIILIVDDEPALQRLSARVLEDAGFVVLEAESPGAALELLRGGAAVDLMLVDIRMPEMSGFELAAMAWVDRPRLPVLFTSGFPNPDRQPTDPPLPLCDFLSKPYTPTQLVSAARTMLPSIAWK